MTLTVQVWCSDDCRHVVGYILRMMYSRSDASPSCYGAMTIVLNKNVQISCSRVVETGVMMETGFVVTGVV